MIPHEVMIIPLFILIRHIPFAGGNDLWGQGGTGWLNSFPGLILPGIVSGYSIFFLRQFFLNQSADLEDAARLDGCGEFGVFWRICLPTAIPALTTLGVFSFSSHGRISSGRSSSPAVTTSRRCSLAWPRLAARTGHSGHCLWRARCSQLCR